MLGLNYLVYKISQIIFLTEALKRGRIVVYNNEDKNEGVEQVLEYRIVTGEIYGKLVIKNSNKGCGDN